MELWKLVTLGCLAFALFCRVDGGLVTGRVVLVGEVRTQSAQNTFKTHNPQTPYFRAII
jgi:hypothetical protein